MELGGNKAAKAYFEKHDLVGAGQHNYTLPLAVKYRSDLAKRAESALQADFPAPAAVPAAIVAAPEKLSEEAKAPNDEFFAEPASKSKPMQLTKKKDAPTTVGSSATRQGLAVTPRE